MNSVVMVVLAVSVFLLIGVVVWSMARLASVRTELARQQQGDAALDAARKAALEAEIRALENRFAELAASQLVARQKDLVGLNAENVGRLFEDLKTRLAKYEREVTLAKEETRTSAVSMAENVKSLQRFASDAQRFTAALVGGNKIQGNQGEAILAGLLEQSGFQRGREYDTQVGQAGDGGRPDVCIYDARNRCAVYVDAKMNIKDFIEAYNLPDDTVENKKAKKAALRKHVTSIRSQIDGLAGRRYAETVRPGREGFENLPLVAMFCPFNAVLEAALGEDPTLMQYAYEKGIVLVTPTSLWGYLWLVSCGWKRVETEKKFEDIQALGGEVVDRVEALLQDVQAVGEALKKATLAWQSLEARAGEKGQKSVRRSARKLLDYGVMPKKEPKLVRACPAEETEEA